MQSEKIVLKPFVPQGACCYWSLAEGDIFGTSGCSPCVGVILTLSDGGVFCAHISHGAGITSHVVQTSYPLLSLQEAAHPREAEGLLQEGVRLLQEVFPEPGKVTGVWFAGQPRQEVSKFTRDCIQEMYPKIQPTLFDGRDNVYAKPAGLDIVVDSKANAADVPMGESDPRPQYYPCGIDRQGGKLVRGYYR